MNDLHLLIRRTHIIKKSARVLQHVLLCKTRYFIQEMLTV